MTAPLVCFMLIELIMPYFPVRQNSLEYNCLWLAVQNGHIKRCTDEDIQSSALELMATNVSTNYISCPADPQQSLGIKLPFLVLIVKNMKKYFTFEVQILDDKNVRRRFRASNYQASAFLVTCHLSVLSSSCTNCSEKNKQMSRFCTNSELWRTNMVIRARFRGRSLVFKPNAIWQPLWCSYFVGFIYSLEFFQKTEQISCLLSLLGHWGTVNNSSEALHLHNATEAGWGLESNTVQSFRFHKEGLWDQLCGDTTCSSACQLPHQAHLLLWPALLWGGAATRIQAFPTHSGELWIYL